MWLIDLVNFLGIWVGHPVREFKKRPVQHIAIVIAAIIIAVLLAD